MTPNCRVRQALVYQQGQQSLILARRGYVDRSAVGPWAYSVGRCWFAIDHSPKAPRFELVQQFLSIQNNERLRLRCPLEGDNPSAPSCIDLWPGAAYMERECWDMFGIQFDGHKNLRRLLMPEAYGHHPLRKEFPHQGIEPDRLYREWERSRIERAAEREGQEGVNS